MIDGRSRNRSFLTFSTNAVNRPKLDKKSRYENKRDAQVEQEKNRCPKNRYRGGSIIVNYHDHAWLTNSYRGNHGSLFGPRGWKHPRVAQRRNGEKGIKEREENSRQEKETP